MKFSGALLGSWMGLWTLGRISGLLQSSFIEGFFFGAHVIRALEFLLVPFKGSREPFWVERGNTAIIFMGPTTLVSKCVRLQISRFILNKQR